MANSKRKCAACKHRFPADLGGSLDMGVSWYHSMECVWDQHNKNTEKNAKKEMAARNKDRRESAKALRELNKRDTRWQHKRTQKTFNRMRKLEELKWFDDHGIAPNCISCNKPFLLSHPGKAWHCGHLKTVGSNSSLRYDAKNTKLQCSRCNNELSGNISGDVAAPGYTQGLLDRFGPCTGNQLIDYCESNREVKRWDWEELEQMRTEFNKRIRELEQ